MKTLFLDFDGVLYDTLKEAYLLCRNVFYGTDVKKPIEQKKYNLFFRYKFLVYNVWQYYYLMKALETKNIEKSYNDFLINRDFVAEKEFEKNFVQKRIELLENESEFVDSLEAPFPIMDIIKKFLAERTFDIVIVSRKNNFAIKRKLRGLDIKIVGKEELENVTDKAEFISEYMKQNNIEKAFFIDDNSHNLTPCKDIKNLTCLLAGWGNIGTNETGLSLDEIIKRLKD